MDEKLEMFEMVLKNHQYIALKNQSSFNHQVFPTRKIKAHFVSQMDIKLLKTYLAKSWNQILNPNFSLKSLANLLEVVRLVF